MERWQLIVLVLVVSVGWFLYKRFVKKDSSFGSRYQPPQPEVENWYAESTQAIEAMDESQETVEVFAHNPSHLFSSVRSPSTLLHTVERSRASALRGGRVCLDS